jgi:hypothetical protein
MPVIKSVLCSFVFIMIGGIILNTGCSKPTDSDEKDKGIEHPLIGEWLYDSADATDRGAVYFKFTPQGTYVYSMTGYTKVGSSWQIYEQLELSGDFEILREDFVRLYHNTEKRISYGATTTRPQIDYLWKFKIIEDTLYTIENMKYTTGIRGVFRGNSPTLIGTWQMSDDFETFVLTFSPFDNEKGLLNVKSYATYFYFDYDSLFIAIDTADYSLPDTLKPNGYKYRYKVINDSLYICTYDSAFNYLYYAYRQ